MRGSARNPTELMLQTGVKRAVARFTPIKISHTSNFEILSPPHRLPSPWSIDPDRMASGQVLKWLIVPATSTHEAHRALKTHPGGGIQLTTPADYLKVVRWSSGPVKM